jgi:hypothetical protein
MSNETRKDISNNAAELTCRCATCSLNKDPQYRVQPLVRINRIMAMRFPLSLADLDGPSEMGKVLVLSMRGNRGVATNYADDLDFTQELDGPGWAGSKFFTFTVLEGGVLRADGKASSDDLSRYRIPVWTQCEETPSCCGRKMLFVGQIDDADICHDRPKNAVLWWHDYATFYVFTCPKCLGVTAVGQQF